MRLSATIAATCLFAGCSSTPAAAEREIRAQYDVIEHAYAAQDLAAILATRDAGLVTVVPGTNGETENYAQFAETMRRWFAQNKPPIHVRYTIGSVEIRSPDEVAVRVLQRGDRYQGDAEPLRHVVHEVRQRETWVRTSSGWKVRKIDEIDLANRKVWVDGEAVPLEKQ